MRSFRLARLFWLLTLVLAACGTARIGGTSSNLVENAAADVQVAADKGAIVGQILDEATGEPMANTGIRMARVFWNEDKSDGAFVLEGATSPGAFTDEQGVYVMNDVPPADYVLVVGEVIGSNVIISEPDGRAKIYTIEAGDILRAEPLKVSLPQ